MMKPLFAGCFILLLLVDVALLVESRPYNDRRRGRDDDDNSPDHDRHRRGGDDDDDDGNSPDHDRHRRGGDDDDSSPDHHHHRRGGDDDDDDDNSPDRDHHRRGGGDDDDDRDHHRRGRDDDDDDETLPKLFVFGDAAADNGNFPDPGLSQDSRAWHYPYGMSDDDNDNHPSGRFSNNMVQSDFLGKILGYKESPPAYSDYKPGKGRRINRIDPSGMNFANASAAVWYEVPKMSEQVEQLKNLIEDGAITKQDLDDSVALIAFSGRDYDRFTSTDKIRSFAFLVTNEMVRIVNQLQDLGVSKILVNTLPPLGCTPSRSSGSDYKHCDQNRNGISDAHNSGLADKLGKKEGVMLLDVNTAVTNLLQSSSFRGMGSSPCCETKDRNAGYCGQYSADGRRPQFTVCRRPDDYFYWDNVHPTHAGWKAVMQKLQRPIMDFLDIPNLNNL
ncbi:hypothetical protein PR202_gb18326 [Eleusine coracana subsp. coracana]|uniref:GDSL esterase/lipase n=1 Tax=Eleusine coracana subsp. coracana TaxID=191504 RepID=A0AAV5F547_ELECO|nr:hypothetical protein PR202_gb18326 [Eleusine coracana subsp. coracana]